ncbi:MAG: hypothetical protein KAS93_00245 [Gammaproteobacteria bacterium]|nr:hypothetical protein [Gammaproteobacteria bacterium]
MSFIKQLTAPLRSIKDNDKALLAIGVIALIAYTGPAALTAEAGAGAGLSEVTAAEITASTGSTVTFTGGAESLALGAEAGAGDILGTAGADVLASTGTEGLVGSQALEAEVAGTLANAPVGSAALETSVNQTLAGSAGAGADTGFGAWAKANPLTTALIAGGVTSAVGAREARKAADEEYARTSGGGGYNPDATYAGTGQPSFQGLISQPQQAQKVAAQGKQHSRFIDRSKLNKLRPQDLA